jgi:hypothetical protein
MEHLKGASHVYAPALLANSRLGWKGLPGKNTLAYCENSQITERKSFIKLSPGLERRRKEYVLIRLKNFTNVFLIPLMVFLWPKDFKFWKQFQQM